MSFHASAQNIRLEDDHVLVADLQNEDEEYVEARFDLDEILGNSDGIFSPCLFLPSPRSR